PCFRTSFSNLCASETFMTLYSSFDDSSKLGILSSETPGEKSTFLAKAADMATPLAARVPCLVLSQAEIFFWKRLALAAPAYFAPTSSTVFRTCITDRLLALAVVCNALKMLNSGELRNVPLCALNESKILFFCASVRCEISSPFWLNGTVSGFGFGFGFDAGVGAVPTTPSTLRNFIPGKYVLRSSAVFIRPVGLPAGATTSQPPVVASSRIWT